MRRPVASRSVRVALPALLAAALLVPPLAGADLADEQALAERLRPSFVSSSRRRSAAGRGNRTTRSTLGCSSTTSRRWRSASPWSRTNLVKIGPREEDLQVRFEYHLDFPGDALGAGCDYELWTRRLAEGSEPTVYAHVATERGAQSSLSRYWFFYTFNDFNNTHEGDWEMIQLVFDADDAREALDPEPVLVGYSSHEGAERAEWDATTSSRSPAAPSDRLPEAGSHANKFTGALSRQLGRGRDPGCDDTRGHTARLRPAVATIPSRRKPPRRFPWIEFGPLGPAQGGVLQQADGPEPEDAVD